MGRNGKQGLLRICVASVTLRSSSRHHRLCGFKSALACPPARLSARIVSPLVASPHALPPRVWRLHRLGGWLNEPVCLGRNTRGTSAHESTRAASSSRSSKTYSEHLGSRTSLHQAKVYLTLLVHIHTSTYSFRTTRLLRRSRHRTSTRRRRSTSWRPWIARIHHRRRIRFDRRILRFPNLVFF